VINYFVELIWKENLFIFCSW